jgi:hypothetical protein
VANPFSRVVDTCPSCMIILMKSYLNQ